MKYEIDAAVSEEQKKILEKFTQQMLIHSADVIHLTGKQGKGHGGYIKNGKYSSAR